MDYKTKIAGLLLIGSTLIGGSLYHEKGMLEDELRQSDVPIEGVVESYWMRESSTQVDGEYLDMNQHYNIAVRTDAGDLLDVEVISSDDMNVATFANQIQTGARVRFPRGNRHGADLLAGDNIESDETYFRPGMTTGQKPADRITIVSGAYVPEQPGPQLPE